MPLPKTAQSKTVNSNSRTALKKRAPPKTNPFDILYKQIKKVRISLQKHVTILKKCVTRFLKFHNAKPTQRNIIQSGVSYEELRRELRDINKKKTEIDKLTKRYKLLSKKIKKRPRSVKR